MMSQFERREGRLLRRREGCPLVNYFQAPIPTYPLSQLLQQLRE